MSESPKQARRRVPRAAADVPARAPPARSTAGSSDSHGTVAGKHRVRLKVLVREELLALPRNTFALATVAIVLGMFAVLGAFVYAGEGGLEEKPLFTWLVAELLVAIVVAARVAGARRSRFVDSLYTTPLDRRTWWAAQALVGCMRLRPVRGRPHPNA